MATTKALSISFDMKKLYDIDSAGGISTLSLTSTHGVKIQSSSAGLNVARATTSYPGTPRVLKVVEGGNINNVWKITYHEGTDTIYIVGITDVYGLTKPRKYTYPLANGGNVLALKRVGDDIHVVLASLI